MRLSVEPVRARLRAPFMAAWGTITERELLLVRLESGDGAVGWGEAAPLPGYGGATAEEVGAALAGYAGVLASGAPRAELLALCAAHANVPEALAAIDLALWDLEARRRGEPAWKVLGGETPAGVMVNATAARADPAEVSATVADARAAGFRCVKVKVAVDDDASRLAAARAAGGEEMALRIDANGAWSVEEALTSLAALERFDLELCEEPVHGLEAIGRVASAVSVPIALDESGGLDGALDRRVCAAVCLKVARCGGISGLLAAAARAREVGYRVYLASTLDGPLGIAAALHAAAVTRPDHACGLATLRLFAGASVGLSARDGRMAPPPGPGLGDGLLDWYR